MWIEVDAAVVPVAKVEMAVEHQHFVLLELGERLLADLFPAVHSVCNHASGLANTVRPPTIVPATPPRSSQPSNGVFFERERNDRAFTWTFSSGARIVISATAPSLSVPPGRRRISAGLADSSSTSRGSRIRPVCS